MDRPRDIRCTGSLHLGGDSRLLGMAHLRARLRRRTHLADLRSLPLVECSSTVPRLLNMAARARSMARRRVITAECIRSLIRLEDMVELRPCNPTLAHRTLEQVRQAWPHQATVPLLQTLSWHPRQDMVSRHGTPTHRKMHSRCVS